MAGSWMLCCRVLLMGALLASHVHAQPGSGGQPDGPSEPPAEPTGAEAKLPTRFIPDDALACAFIYPAPLLGAEELKLMPIEVARAWCVENIGVDPIDIDYAVAVTGVPGPAGANFGIGVSLHKDFTIEQLNQDLFVGPAVTIDGLEAYRMAEATPEMYLHQAGPRSAVIATREYLAKMVGANGGTGPLPKLVASLPPIAPVMAAAVIEPVRDVLKQATGQVAGELPPPLVGAAKIPELLDAVVVATGFGRGQKFQLLTLSPDEEAAIELERVINDALRFGRDMTVAQSMQQIEGSGPIPEATRAYVQRLAGEIVTMLTPRRTDRRLSIEIKNEGWFAGTGVLVGLLLPAVQAARTTARQMSSGNNLKQIGLALHNYHNTHGHLPEPASRDAEGRPLLSWRVAILPYLEQYPLYEQFHLDEPWDSEHNAKLIERMPDVFAHPNVTTAPGETVYQAVVGQGLGLKPEGTTRFSDITDGTVNTIAVVEADVAEAVPWTKPSDIEIDLADPLAKMSKASPMDFYVLFFDGSVRALAHTIDPQVFAAMLTRAGGEVVPVAP